MVFFYFPATGVVELGTTRAAQPNFYRPFVKILKEILQCLDFLKTYFLTGSELNIALTYA